MNKKSILIIVVLLVITGVTIVLLFSEGDKKDKEQMTLQERAGQMTLEEKEEQIESDFIKIGAPVKVEDTAELGALIEIRPGEIIPTGGIIGVIVPAIVRFSNTTDEEIMIFSDNESLFKILPVQSQSFHDVEIKEAGTYKFTIEGMEDKEIIVNASDEAIIVEAK